MATRGATTGTVTAWTDPEERDKRQTLSAVYEMSGIKPPTDNVERWIIAGWPHVCKGLTVAQVQEAFMLCMAGRLRDADGQPVTLDLYGRQFALNDFARVVSAYRYQYQTAALRARSEEALRNAEAYQRRKEAVAARKATEEMKRRLAEAYAHPHDYEDWGDVVYKRIVDNNLLGEVADYSAEITARAEKRLSDGLDKMRAVLDREYRKRQERREPDIHGETVRKWIELQREKNVTAVGMLKKLKYM